MSETETDVASEEEAQIIVTLFGQPLTLVLPGKWSFTDARIVKETYGILAVGAEAGLFSGDPDAYLAVLHISYRRAGREFPAEALGEMNLFDLIDSVTEALNKLREELPPTPPSGNDSTQRDEPSSSEPKEEPVSA